jgi:hypothetical protein
METIVGSAAEETMKNEQSMIRSLFFQGKPPFSGARTHG